jgi:hypothetical protein
MKLAVIALALMVLNGCPVQDGPPSDDPCGARDLQHLIGARVPSAAALKAIGPERIRVIRPGDAVTMDHAPTRLNIELDAADIVVQLRCG